MQGLNYYELVASGRLVAPSCRLVANAIGLITHSNCALCTMALLLYCVLYQAIWRLSSRIPKQGVWSGNI